MKSPIKYGLMTFMVFLVSCIARELTTTQEFKDNNRSSKIERRTFKDGLMQFLDYRVYNEIALGSVYDDSIIRPGIILEGRSVQRITTQKKMQFGNGTDTCIIRYNLFQEFYHYGRSATISVINLFSTKKMPQKTEDHLIDLKATGTIEMPDEAVNFSFSAQGGNPDYVNGSFSINTNSFLLKPVLMLNKKSGNSFLTLQLLKGDILYAALMRSPNKIFLYTKATAKEQMLIAAYFAVIAGYWYSPVL